MSYEAIVQLLIHNGADVNVQDEDGWTALMRASADNNKAVVQLLIDSGAEINAQLKTGWLTGWGERSPAGSTALILASHMGKEEIVQLLLGNGAYINAQNKEGWTALDFALQNGHNAVAQLLIKKGADVKANA
jgi:serine/threonine-protein phosphatase 6 regulatory ankyrin repeat subunit B